MKLIKKQPVLQDVTENIICDRCECSCIRHEITDPDGNLQTFFEYATVSWNWGYWSDYDGDSGELQLCDVCTEEVRRYIKRGINAVVNKIKPSSN